MNTIHSFLINHIREQATIDAGDLMLRFSAMSDEDIVRLMFLNYRDQRGFRLTKIGLQIMQMYFRGHEVPMPEGERLHPKELLYLDSKATMPYYCNKDGYVFYDANLAIKVKLASGRIQTLIEIES